ncbi:Rap1a/Tai family immunity protein [Kiloniella laminariae]|uniref:Rap1a/Tai family immunity protein n=1 Tax=Kiloniella laminariae TaxID=454162 RepID=A0ABT4LFA7_9PROT|nr:Rap1a/Tai family immunity protein [Kiloniella laminariae]MCZ4279788.1 Rap1a/Tai family immunity protein [Kiloniella laminariae]
MKWHLPIILAALILLLTLLPPQVMASAATSAGELNRFCRNKIDNSSLSAEIDSLGPVICMGYILALHDQLAHSGAICSGEQNIEGMDQKLATHLKTHPQEAGLPAFTVVKSVLIKADPCT